VPLVASVIGEVRWRGNGLPYGTRGTLLRHAGAQGRAANAAAAHRSLPATRDALSPRTHEE